MTLSSTIEDAWNNAIWTHNDIQVITDKIHKFTATRDSELEVERYYFDTKINYIEVTTNRAVFTNETAKVLGGVAVFTFFVDISYTREIETDDTSYLEVRDFFETLLDLVFSKLGGTWTTTVDYWRPQEKPAEIREILIENKRCWRGQYGYVGTVTATL